MANFICEIDNLSCSHRHEIFPNSCSDYAKKVEKHIKNNLIPNSIRYAFFKITSTCNSDCAYCEHAFSHHNNKEEISLPDLLSVIKQLGELGVTSCSLSGGEPLIYRYIDEAVAAMIDNNIEPILLTNGVLLPNKIQHLYDLGLRYVIMSLDSFESDHYKKTRGIDFDSIMRSYNYMVEFKDKNKDFHFSLTTVISKENIDDIIPLIRKVNADNIGIQFTPYHNFINTTNDMGIENIIKIKQVTEMILSLKRQGNLIYNSKEYLEYFPMFFETKKRVPEGYVCKCGYNAVYIWPNLDVRSCWSTSLPNVGNLKEKSLFEIWQSDIYVGQRAKMLSCACEGCWLLCTAEFNIMHEKYLQDRL